MSEIRANFLLDIQTVVPRRLTTYRGLTSDGRRGIIYGNNYYKSAIVEWPGIDEADTTAPLQIEITIGNAENDYTDLFSNTANHRKPIIIYRLDFSGSAVWTEALAPTFTATTWFEGVTGRPRLAGEQLRLECYADMGRRGKSPRTKSRSLMTSHQPLTPGQTMAIMVRTK